MDFSLAYKIHNLRQELNYLYQEKKSLTDSQVLAKSQKLDELILQALVKKD